MVFRLLENVFFTLYLICTQAKLCTRFLPLRLRQMEISHPPHDVFLKMGPPAPPPPELKGGGYINFVNLHILCLC